MHACMHMSVLVNMKRRTIDEDELREVVNRLNNVSILVISDER